MQIYNINIVNRCLLSVFFDRKKGPLCLPAKPQLTRFSRCSLILLQHVKSKLCFGSNLGHILCTDTHETRATATFPCDLHPCRSLPCLHSSTSMLFPPAAAEWAKPSGSAAALRRQAYETMLNRRCIAPLPPLSPAPQSAHSQTLAFPQVL